MRLAFVMVMTLAGGVWAITPEVWTNHPGPYTNALGHEFVQEVRLREAWRGNTNWIFTNSAKVTLSGGAQVSIALTNTMGERFLATVGGEAVTGAIPFRASDAERLTDALEGLLTNYTLPFFSRSPDWCFDSWFSNGLSRWPTNHKAELMYHYPDCGITVSEGASGTNCSLQVWTNSFGEVIPDIIGGETVTPRGHWTKRHNRIDPLIVAEWRRFPKTETPDLTVTNAWECYRGWPNEFSPAEYVPGFPAFAPPTALFGLTNAQYPVFVVHPGTTNSPYAGGLFLRPSDQNVDESGAYGIGYQYYAAVMPAPLPGSSEWTNNILRQYAEGTWGWGNIVLASATQRSDRAWLSLGAPLTLDGATSDTNVVVSLQYTNRMNTYEWGTAWDAVLLPEQTLAHYVAFTNLFLTPVETNGWHWTNSIVYNYETNFGINWTTNPIAFEITGNATGNLGGTVNGWYVPTTMGGVGYLYGRYGDIAAHRIFDGGVTPRYWLAEYIGGVPRWRGTNEFGPYFPYDGGAQGTAWVSRCNIPGKVDGAGNVIPEGVFPYGSEYSDLGSITTNIWPVPFPAVNWWEPLIRFPHAPAGWHLLGSSYATNANLAPVDYLAATGLGQLAETYDITATIDPGTHPEPENPTNTFSWNYTTWRGDTNIAINAAGSGVVASVCVTNLYEGTPHRVHTYVKTLNTNAYALGPSPYYHRVGLTAWTTNATVITDPIDPRMAATWQVNWTNSVLTDTNRAITYHMCDSVPYISFPNSSFLSSNYTHQAKFITNGFAVTGYGAAPFPWTNIPAPALAPWSYTFGDYSNALVLETQYGFYTQTVAQSVTTNSGTKYTVAGWAREYWRADSFTSERLQTPPPSYSWPGFATTNDPLTKTFSGTSLSGINVSNLIFRGAVESGLWNLRDDGTYSNLTTHSHIVNIPPWWYFVGADGNADYALNDRWPWLADQYWIDVGGGGGDGSCFLTVYMAGGFTNAATVAYTNNFEVIPSGWQAYDSIDPSRTIESVYWWQPTAWQGLSDPSYRYGYKPTVTPYAWTNRVVPYPMPDIQSLGVKAEQTTTAREWLDAATNWMNAPTIKIMVEWQR